MSLFGRIYIEIRKITTAVNIFEYKNELQLIEFHCGSSDMEQMVRKEEL